MFCKNNYSNVTLNFKIINCIISNPFIINLNSIVHYISKLAF